MNFRLLDIKVDTKYNDEVYSYLLKFVNDKGEGFVSIVPSDEYINKNYERFIGKELSSIKCIISVYKLKDSIQGHRDLELNLTLPSEFKRTDQGNIAYGNLNRYNLEILRLEIYSNNVPNKIKLVNQKVDLLDLKIQYSKSLV